MTDPSALEGPYCHVKTTGDGNFSVPGTVDQVTARFSAGGLVSVPTLPTGNNVTIGAEHVVSIEQSPGEWKVYETASW